MCQCKCQPETSFRKNEAQLEFLAFETRFPESYHSGFKTGIEWDANWMPGGPWVYSGTKLPELRHADEIKYKNWHSGFNDGLAVRLKNNAHFADWWKRNRGKVYHTHGVDIDQIRYKDPEEIYPQPYDKAA